MTARRDTEPPLVLTVAQAKTLLGDMGINQIYAAIARGDIPSVKIGRRILIPRQRLLEMINGGGTDATK
jgi:excisionase family DNA binding protein